MYPILVGAILFAFSGCGDSFETQGIARFTEPQPNGKQALLQFPPKIRGTYLSLNDSSEIFIGPSNINRVYDYWNSINKNELDSNVVLTNDSLYDIENKSKYRALLKGDRIWVHYYSNKVVFSLDSEHILKQFKGHYFLSSKRKEDSLWTVQKLTQAKDELRLSIVLSEEDLNKLGEVTDTDIDTGRIQTFNPSKRAFKRFVKKEGFSEWEVFRKIK